MEYFRNRLAKKQSNGIEEEVAIQTLSNRLQHATLAADRRSAVLGLKSFSRQFRESVVQHGIRPLLATLDKDSDNAQMVKAILETLLVLFLRGDKTEDEASGWIASQSRFQNGKYPSALLMGNVEADQFSMWIADEVTASETHLRVLIGILQESLDYHIRLYTLQLFEFLVCTRPARTKDTLINIPLAVPAIVSLLNDVNDPVRNEAILVLMALLNNNYNIQKLVAFENTFDRLFEIIEEEGGIRGSILVQDCLTLLTNLLMYNASNQKYFLETECVPKLAKLLAEPIEESLKDEIDTVAPPIVWTEQRLQNMTIALEICDSFLDEDNPEIHMNQEKLFHAGIFFCTMRLVFSPLTENPIRKTALHITGDMIAGNSELQLQFSQVDVPYIDPSMPNQLQKFEKPIPVPVALLNWTLLLNSVHVFEIRLAAIYCLRCFFKDNSESKIAFLTDQAKASQNLDYYDELLQDQAKADDLNAEGNLSGEGDLNGEREPSKPVETVEGAAKVPYANIFQTLMDFDFANKLNPYRVWFAATVLVYLFEDCPENRLAARELKIGNADDGEEVMTCIQAISGILVTTLDDQDPRIAIGLMNLLTIWFYEDFDAVNDFLSDSSIIKSILAFLTKNSTESSDLVHGMASILIGIAYEFSQKSSPIPRIEMHSLVTKALGVNNYALKVKQFKECDEFVDFVDPFSAEVERDSTGLPKVYFISTYVTLIKDNYYRIRKALSHNPNVEPQIRISYEVFEVLESKNAQLAQELKELKEEADRKEEKLQSDIMKAQEELRLSQELLEKSTIEVSLLRESEVELTDRIEILSAELTRMETEKSKFEKSSEEYSLELQKLSKQNYSNEGSLNLIKQKLSETEAAKKKAEDGINKMSRELFQLTRQKKELETKVGKLEKEISQLKTYNEMTIKDCETQLTSVRTTNEGLRAKIRVLEQQLKDLSVERDQGLMKLREIQARATEAESGNENLMKKLRSAAEMVQDLRKANMEQTAQTEALKIELSNKATEAQNNLNFQEELRGLRDRNQALETMIASMKEAAGQDNDEVQKSLIDALETKSTHEVKVKSLMNEIETLKANISLERAQFEQSQSSFQETIQKLEVKNEESIQRTSELEALSVSLKAALEKFNENEKLLKQQIESKEQEIQSLQKELTDAIETASALQSDLEEQLDTLNNEVKELQTGRIQAQEDYNKLKTEYSNLQARHNQLLESREGETEKSTSEESVSDDQSREWSEKLEKKSDDLAKAETKIAELEDQYKLLTEKVEQTESECQEKNIKSEKAQEQFLSIILELEKSKAQLMKDIEDLNATHSKMIDSLKENDNEEVNDLKQADILEKHDEDLQRALNDNENLKTDYERIKRSLEELERANIANEDAKLQADVTIKQLTESVESLKNELSVAQQEKVELTEKKEKLQDEVNAKELSKTDRSSSLTSLQNGSHSKDTVKDALSKEVANKIAELLEKDQLISDITKKLENSTVALESLTERNEVLEKEMKDMSKAVEETKKVKDALEKQVQHLEGDMESAIILNDNLNQELDDKAEELKKTIAEFQADREGFKEEISNHLGVEKELTKQINSLEKELKKRVADHEKDKKRFSGGAEAVLLENTDTITKLEATIQALKESQQAQVKELEDTHIDKYCELETQYNDLVSKCEELTEKLNGHEAAKTEWEALEKERQIAITKCEEKLTESKELVKAKEEEIASLKTQIEESTKNLQDTICVLTEKQAEMDLLHKEDVESREALEEDLKSTREECSVKEQDIQKLKTELELSKASLEELMSKFSKAEAQIEDQATSMSQLEGTIASLQAQMTKLENELDATKSTLSDKKQELKEAESKLVTAMQEAHNAEDYESVLSDLKHQILDLLTKLNAAEDENKTLLSEVSDTNEKQTSLAKQWDENERKLKEEISERAEELAKLENELSSTLAANAELETASDIMKKSLDEISLAKAQLEADLASVSSDLNVEKLLDSELSNQIAHLQTKARESDELVFDLKTKLGDYVEEKMALEKDVADAQAEQQKLIEHAEELEDEKKELQAELEAKEASLSSLEKSEEDGKHSLDEITSQANKLKQDYEEQTKKLDQLTAQLEKEISLNKDAVSEISQLTEKVEVLELAHLAEKEDWEARYREITTQKSDLQSKLEMNQAQLQDAENETKKLKEEAEANRKAESVQVRSQATVPAENGLSENQETKKTHDLESQISSLKKQLEEKEKIESDFDELVVLWEEQEKRVLKYKLQLRALNQDVSSDEDENDDDDEQD